MLTDLDFFEQEIEKYKEALEVPMVEKRMQEERMRENPMEELQEVYIDVQTLETDFKKTIDIIEHLIKHYRDLFLHNKDLVEEYDRLQIDNQSLANQRGIQERMVKQTEERDRQLQQEKKEHEA
jgi:uncharacterized protein (DUF3084 family)